MRRHESMTADAVMTHEGAALETMSGLLQTIRAARDGDRAAFEEIMVLTERRVAQIAWRILGDAEEVKEAVQETFLRLFRHFGRYDEKQDLQAWLSRITVNVCLDALRRQKRERMFEPLDETHSGASNERPADVDLMHRDDLALLRRAIEALPARERMAVLLRDVEGLSTVEVAAALGNSMATVRVQLCRARVKLRRFIQSWPGGQKP